MNFEGKQKQTLYTLATVVVIVLVCLFGQHLYLSSKINSAEEKYNEIKQEFDNLTQTHDELKTEFESTSKDKIQNLQADYERLESSYKALQVLCDKQQQELKDCKKMQNGDFSNSESTHPIQQLNKRLQQRRQEALKKQSAENIPESEATTEDSEKEETEGTPEEQDTTQGNNEESASQELPVSETQQQAIHEGSQNQDAELLSESVPNESPQEPQIAKETLSNNDNIEKEVKADSTPQNETQTLPESTSTAQGHELDAPAEAATTTSSTEEKNQILKPSTPTTVSEPVAEAPTPKDKMVEKEDKPSASAPSSVEKQTAGYACPSAKHLNESLESGSYQDKDITWWLNFSFRPLGLQEEIKQPFKAMYDGQFIDCYYKLGPKDSSEMIEEVWLVYRGIFKEGKISVDSSWAKCEFEGCLNTCEIKKTNSCGFSLEK